MLAITQDTGTTTALVTAVAAALVSVGGFLRSWVKQAQEAGARQRAEEAAMSSAASKAGVDILTGSLDTFQKIVVSLQGQIGVVEGMLRDCRDERQVLGEQNKAHEKTITRLTSRIEELERKVS